MLASFMTSLPLSVPFRPVQQHCTLRTGSLETPVMPHSKRYMLDAKGPLLAL